MSRRFLLSTSAAMLVATAAIAADFAAPSTKPDAVPSGTYNLDKSHANIIFNLSHLGYSRYFGRFNAFDSTIEWDAKAPEKSKLSVTVFIDSIDTNHDKLEEDLKGEKWFDAKKFPTATFTSTKVEKLTATTGKVHGDFTLHGITKPVTLDVTFNGGGENPYYKTEQLGFSATGQINRSDFGVSEGVPMVGDTVALTIEAEYHRKK